MALDIAAEASSQGNGARVLRTLALHTSCYHLLFIPGLQTLQYRITNRVKAIRTSILALTLESVPQSRSRSVLLFKIRFGGFRKNQTLRTIAPAAR
jgi:hypothetical protein